jgi:catechol 2,3-dioxygenase-like lactoylglutathione lyase family enzyme
VTSHLHASKKDSILGLAEVVIWSKDIDASLAFYRDLLGLSFVADSTGLPIKFLRAGEGVDRIPEMIVLVPHPEKEVAFPKQKADRVLHHMALAVDANRYDDLRHKIEEAGIEVRMGMHPVLEGVRTFYCDDPDGNEVEFIAKDRRGRIRN